MAFIFGVLSILSAPGFALAEIRAGSQELGIHLGAFFGDDLTDTAVSGQQPELGDDFAIGINYTYNLVPNWGLEGRYTFNPSTAENTPKGDIDLDVHLLDLNLLYYVNPKDPVVFYGTAGAGWALGDIDEDISGTVNGVPVTISDDNGFTFNVGIGLKFEVTRQISLRLDGRYRFIDQLVDEQKEQLNTFETTAGISWVF